MGELMDIVWFIILAIGAYLLGSVPAAYLAIKWSRGVDIRKVGTGKVGAANVLNAGPKWLAIPVALFDIGKGALVVWIAKFIGLNAAQQVTVGFLAIVGHNWPIYLGFKSSGRGVFVSLGVISMLSWQIGLIMLIGPYLFAPIKQVAFGVFLAFVSLPFLSYFPAETMGVRAEDKVAITGGFVVLSVMALLKRVVAHRTELSKNLPWGGIIFYRLLFDRDIADRKLWNSRNTTIAG
jgi:acyl phosphate:glycerol-3-phosphate acyltransferase